MIAHCSPWICEPGTVGCALMEEKVVACSADGLTATVKTACDTIGQVCAGGACAPMVCPAGKRFCQQNELRACSPKGDSSTLEVACTSYQYCDSASVSCKDQVCSPNLPACNDGIATTCNADGSGYVAGGTDCTVGAQTCYQGTCRTLACTPNAYYCEAGNVRHCSASGLTSTPYQTCTPNQYCDPTNPPTCRTRRCTPGLPACDANVATTCNSDGSGYTGTRTDTTTFLQICTQGTCSANTVDVIGMPNAMVALTTASMKLNFYSVAVGRTLTKIEQAMDGASGDSLTWVVYEASSQTGTYVNIFSLPVTGTAASGYQSSGTISVHLASGRYYAIGVSLDATSLTFYLDSPAPSVPQTTSFGTLTSAKSYFALVPFTVTWSAPTTFILPQRLTTSP
jgi:hypothetical protein